MWLATVQIELMQEQLSVRNSSWFYPRLRGSCGESGDGVARGLGTAAQDGPGDGVEPAAVDGVDGVAQAVGPHDPAKVLVDLAVALALGGDWLADVALLRAAPELFGPVASDPIVSGTIDAL